MPPEQAQAPIATLLHGHAERLRATQAGPAETLLIRLFAQLLTMLAAAIRDIEIKRLAAQTAAAEAPPPVSVTAPKLPVAGPSAACPLACQGRPCAPRQETPDGTQAPDPTHSQPQRSQRPPIRRGHAAPPLAARPRPPPRKTRGVAQAPNHVHLVTIS